MKIDLHCHSLFSDGSLTPKQLIDKAKAANIEIFAITDHDNIDAYKELDHIENYSNPTIISGIEFSTSWNKIGIHIVGLNFDINSDSIKKAIYSQKQSRITRAKIISKRLEKHGLFNAYENITENNPNKQIGRPDFANLLVEKGIVKDWNHAFKKYLGAGKPCDVKNQWLDYQTIISAIKQAGGIAILAHPLYYKLTNSKLKRLLTDFKNSGGQGIEVINGYQNSQKTEYLIKLCKEFNLKASIGSDFHHENTWTKLGCDSKLVNDLDAIWDEL